MKTMEETRKTTAMSWRLLLTFQSMTPLFFVMAAKYAIAFLFPVCNERSSWIPAAVFAALLAIGFASLLLLKKDAGYSDSLATIRVEGGRDDMMLGFLSTMVVPFVSSGSTKINEMLLVAIVTISLFVITFACELYYGNPMLGLLGYRSFEFREIEISGDGIPPEKADVVHENKDIRIGIAKREESLEGYVLLRDEGGFCIVKGYR